MDMASVSGRLSSKISVSDRLSHSAIRRGTAEESQEIGLGRLRDDGMMVLSSCSFLHLGVPVKKNALSSPRVTGGV